MNNLAFYSESVALSTILPINKGLSSATEATMISFLGAPHLPLTTTCQNSQVSDLVREHLVTDQVAQHIKVSGLSLAVKSLKAVLATAFQVEPGLQNFLHTQGMLCVRHRKPILGGPSTHISNHSWGTAIDFNIEGQDAPRNTGQSVPRFIAVMVPIFNKAGWYSGIAFHDTMHFEVADETIRQWSSQGSL
jgi:D-alanyl-D-alanine carboxypeptidase